jgi:hypothetical protein
MKKVLLLIVLILSLPTANAQLEKGSKLAGAQLNLLVNDMYYTMFEFGSSGFDKYFGVSIVPTYGIAVQRNWIVGAQATLGIKTSKFDGGGAAYTANYLFTDFGLAPFTRLYLDITRKGKLKVFGAGALELNVASERISYSGSVTTSRTYRSKTTLTPSAGGGIAYFGKKISLDLSMSTTALRFGFYKVIPYHKK